MKITNEIKTAHANLSNTNAWFLEFVEKNPDSIKRSNFTLLELNAGIFKLQPWPTFINQYKRKEMEEAGISVYNLIKSIPKRLFANDPYKISKYYEIPVDTARKQLAGVSDSFIDNLIARGDFIFSSSGWQCLEYNVTPNLGGWQSALWESLYLNTPIISKFLDQYKVKIINQNLIDLFLDHIINGYLDKLSNGNPEINIALVTPPENVIGNETIELYFGELYKKKLRAVDEKLRGQIRFCIYEDLNTNDAYLFYKDKKIDILVEMHHGFVPYEIMEVFELGNIDLYNGPITDLLSSKLNLALLSENENSALFSSEEKALIKQHIPWSRKVIPGCTNYGADKINIEDFIRSNRKNFVLKPSQGYGGEGICIGRNASQEQWENALNIALKEKHWLVQEYIETTPYLYQRGEDGCVLHDGVWGFFVFGPRYSGEWLRVLPKLDNKGVINCHQGAEVSVIFEVEE